MARAQYLRELWSKALKAGPGERERIISTLVSSMDLEEKVRQLHGSMSPAEMAVSVLRYNHRPFRAGEDPELGIPPLLFTDGPRGIAVGNSTCFPVSMARGASWDPDLEETIGRAMGREARARGANLVGAPCINLLRHPGWGRAQETYGEDPIHVGEMGAALVRGLQEEALACPKHFACNSIEESRFRVDVIVDEKTLREVYLPHFRRCVEEGAACVMSAYNRVNGEYCAHNRHLLRDILKGEWGFEGVVVSDFVLGTRDTVKAILGGLDLEMPHGIHYGRRLVDAVKKGRVPEKLVDEAVRRVLAVKARYFSRATAPPRSSIGNWPWKPPARAWCF
ncbi:MAG: glycoside hydrolase family 3 N-terminal domain-containing protein [Candidatus Geothermincolales bacterium]